ncbi:hypothetical protein, partial [Methylocapsa sp. S129]|uniref:beta strand repeat-containing protein n=1 Tax=Methylocapsa sp. S129 TaxID=1641869 RepID=UPI00131DF6F2
MAIAQGSQQYNALSAQYTAQIQAANPTISAAALAAQVASDISAFDASQTAQYHMLNTEVGGLTTTFDKSFVFTATAAQQASLTSGATWTEEELGFSLSAGVLKTITDTNPVVKAPNVSGRTVTINAALGVGETIVLPGQTVPGVAIPAGQAGIFIAAGTDPTTLTDAEKVALATAERSDLDLTISSIQLPAGAITGAQQDAYNAYVAASSPTNVVLHFGTDPAPGTMEAVVLEAAAQGVAVKAGTYLAILDKCPVNFAATTALNVTVTHAPDSTIDIGDAYLASRGSAELGSIEVPGETRIKVIDSIANAAGLSLVQTGNIILEAADGDIGFAPPGAGFTLNLSPLAGATITARAQNGVNINVVGDANVDTLYSPQNITLTASGSIFNANDDQLINILGTVVTLAATMGSIGSLTDTLNVAVNNGGDILATATTPGASVDLFGPAGNDFVIRSVDAGGTVALTAAADGTIDGNVLSNGLIDLVAGGRLILTQNADVVPTIGAVSIDAASLKMLNGALVDAALGDVDIQTSGDALVTGVTSGSADPDAVSIISGGHVLAGTNPNRVDITALTPGAGVSITASLGIGDETEADSEANDSLTDAPGAANLITPTPNALIIKTGTLSLTATAGDVDVTTAAVVASATITATTGSVNLRALQDFTAADISAPLGNLDISGDGALSLPLLSAGTGPGAMQGQINLDAQTTLTLGTATSGGTQNLVSQDDLVFTQLTTTGIPGDPGNVDLTSTNGAIRGGAIDANGGVDVNGQAVTLDTVSATMGPVLATSATTLTGVKLDTLGAAILTAGGNIDWTTLNVDATLVANSTGGTLTLGTATSGGTQNLVSQGDLVFTQLTTTGIPGDPGNVDLTSTSGAIRGGAIDANGGVDVNGQAVALDTVSATMGPVLATSATMLTGVKLDTLGAATLTAGGNIDWTILNVGATLVANSTSGTLTLGTATSGGTQNLVSQGDLVFTQLTTTGIPGDPGNVGLTSTNGAIRGSAIDANGGVDVNGQAVTLDTV